MFSDDESIGEAKENHNNKKGHYAEAWFILVSNYAYHYLHPVHPAADTALENPN